MSLHLKILNINLQKNKNIHAYFSTSCFDTKKEKGFKQQKKMKLDISYGKYVPLASAVKFNVKKTGYVINEK